MKKDRFIVKKGKTQTPFPIYPNEIRDGIGSLKRLNSKDIDTEILPNKTFSQFAFNLILPSLLKAVA